MSCIEEREVSRSLGAVTSILGLVWRTGGILGEFSGSRGQPSSQSFYVVYCFLKFTPNTYLAVTERPVEKKLPILEILRWSASRQVTPCRFTRELLNDAMNAADAARRYGYCSVPRVIRLDSVLMLKTIKCDLNKPECLRCCKAGIKCSGPKDSRTFINRNAANLTKQTDRKALVCALQNRRKSKSIAADFERLK
jgi:hypothetical protein